MSNPMQRVKEMRQDNMSSLAAMVNSETSPLRDVAKANVPAIAPLNAYFSDDTIEGLGANLKTNIRATGDKILSSMKVGGFDELGQMLAVVESQANKLDPNSIQKFGLAGLWQKWFGNLKLELTKNFKDAQQVFDQLENKMKEHIAVHRKWLKDLDSLYMENFQNFESLMKVISTAKDIRSNMEQQLQATPPVDENDPYAAMKAQQRQEMISALRRIDIKIDYLNRMKVILENNGPKIKSQQETSRMVIATLNDVIDLTLPVIQQEFVLYLHGLDSQKSIKLKTSADSMANSALQKSADTAKQTAVDAATAFNTASISTETLNHVRNRMLETISEVNKIHADAASRRAADAQTLDKSQKEYLKLLQSENAI